MPSWKAFIVSVSLSLVLVVSQEAQAAPSENTVMTVGEMCGGCVKRITTRLKQVPGITDITCDVAKKSVTVTIGEGGPSPRTLWITMEEIGKTPVQMVSPQGTFSEKPKE
jgi:copper chaperone CopZ